ncbi:MAG: hypothetical protein NC238_05270 [Dehalobacter sp.]|nr:hypothetical protein [Dehalobacter sp.]
MSGIATTSTISAEREATFATHGQLIFGTESIYLSHLPMFMFDVESHPHNYQVIMEVDLPDDGTNSKANYISDRKDHQDTRIYTLAPERFSMVDLISNDTDKPIRSFKGDIYREHFERPGKTNIISNATFNVKNIIYSHKFDPNAENLKSLEYLLFGRGKEIFMAHIITKPPDFDQVLAVDRVLALDAVNPVLSDEELSDKGIRVFLPRRENNLTMRLKEGETVQGERFRLDPSEAKLEINIGKEIYFEENELSEFCDPCHGANATWHKP